MRIDLIHSRKLRAWVVLVALLTLILILALVFLAGRSQKQFDMDELYGLLD
jgi:ABC-type transporter Mla subunit MlaD